MATFTTITGGGARLASAGSPWVGGTPPNFTGVSKDVIIVAVGTTLTQDVDARLGNKAVAGGHAFQVRGTSASSFGEYVIPAGVTVTLEGFDTGSNTLGLTQQFARFTVKDGATVKYDVAPTRTSCLDLRGITDIDAATFDAAAGMLNWANAGSGGATNNSGLYDRDNNIQCYDLGKRWISNAGATALGTSEDSSVAFTGVSPAGTFATRVASIEACDAPGKFYIDHEVGVVYFRNTAAFSFSATYKFLTYPDVSIRAIQNTSHNELTVDGATFNYWGANAVAEDYLLNVQNKRCASLASDRRLFRATDVTFNFCKRICGLKLVTGTAADMIVLSGWRVRAYADGTNLGPVLSLYRTNTSYVKFSNCSGNGFEHPWFCRFTVTSVHDNLLFEHQAWESVGLFEAGGTSANPLLVTYPDSVIDGVFHRGVGSAINTSIDNRAVSGFGGAPGRPSRLTNSVFWRSMRWLNLASYQSVSDCVLGHTYHHGINGPSTLSDIQIQGVEVRRHLNLECDNGGFVELGYNRRQFFDGAVVEHCTVYHNRAGNIGSINAAFTFGDLGDNFGPQLITGLTFRSNLIEACGTGVRRGIDIPGNMLRLGIDAADYNCVHGSTVADFAGSFSRFATFTHAGGIEYNTDAARNCLGLTLHNPSHAQSVSESPGRTLEFTRNSVNNRTVAWGGGAAQQLVQDSGTATGASNGTRNGTLTDSAKVWSTSQVNAATPIGRWVEIVGGTGAGQVRRITNTNSNTLTVVPAWTTTPDTTSSYVIVRSELLGLTDGVRTVDVGVDARRLPATSAVDTGIGTALRGVSVDPAFTAPTRDLRSWDVAQGGPGTETHAVALLRATPTLVKSSLYPYLMAGFAPTAEALRTAGHDGTAIGAVPMAPAPAPTIFLNPTSLTFDATAGGAAPAAQTVAITNTGTGTLDHLSRSIAYGGGASGWLSATFVGGTTAPTSLEVTADPAGLAAGTYTATIAVSSAAAGVTNSPQTVEVSFTVAPAPAPTIALDPTTLTFEATVGGAAPAAQSVSITNAGTGTLDQLAEFITYGSGSGWLSVSFVGGTTAPTTLQVSVNPAGLAAGVYSATVSVTSTAGGVTNSPQTVDVTFTLAPAPAPTITLDPTSLSFAATAGGTPPASQSVAITNTGTGTLDQLSRSVSYGSGASGWLTASFVGGTTAPTSLEVSVDPTGLAAGVHTATIAVSSTASGVTNSPQLIDVTFMVAPAPAPTIVLDPTALSFSATAGGAAPAAQSVAVTNGGTGTLDQLARSIAYGSGDGWLTAVFVGGTTAPTSLEVTADPTGLAVGVYTATIAVSSTAGGVTNSPQTVDVSLTVVAAPAPTIFLDPTTLSFDATEGGAAPVAQSVAITNTGTGTLDQLARSITYGSGDGWLSAVFVGGTTAPTSLEVSADPTGLVAGTYTATIAVSSTAAGVTNSPQLIDVTLTVVPAPAPTIVLDPTALSFAASVGGAAPAAQSVAITNTGTGTLDQLARSITYGSGDGWLTASFVGGTTAPTTLEVSVDPTGLVAGSYTATIAVSSTASGVTNSPQTVEVTLTVVAAPTIALAPSGLAFETTAGGPAPAPQSVAITNTGTGTLDQLARAITYGSGDGWLTAVFVGGTTAPTSLEVTADPTGLAVGVYTATIAVSSAASGVTNSPQTVEVSLTVVAAPAPTIALSPSGLAFDATAGGAAPGAQSVAITNTGTGTLDQLARSITYGSGDGWLSAVFVGGTTAPTSLEVSVDPTGLAAGVYSATIAVSSTASGVTNSPQTVDVSLTLVAAPAPTITLAPTGLSFDATAGGAAPGAQSVAITNTGTGTLDQLARSITYGSGDGWLTAVFVGGTAAPTSLEVSADPTGLAAGVYSATIAVSSTAAGVTNSPQSVDVSFTVVAAPAPTIALSPSGLAFDATAGGAAPGAQSVAITNTGTGTLDQLARSITYESGDGWLSAVFVGGTTAPTSLDVSVDPSGLAAGVYTATIAVSSTASGVTNSPQLVYVSLTVAAAVAPTIALSPTGLSFEAVAGGAPPAAQTVDITNAGTGTLDQLVAGWLTVSFVGGTTAPTSLQVTADPTGLTPGVYTMSVTVASGAPGVTNSPQMLQVSFTIVAPSAPMIALSPSSLTFDATAGGAAPGAQSVAITNTGTGTLDQLARSITYGSGDGWLTASFVGGTTAPTSLEVSADPTGLAAGTYTATVSVSSAASGVTNSPQSVDVSLTVVAAPAPTIALSPSSLTFDATAGGAAPAAQSVAITNTGTGTLDQLARSITYGSGDGWLTASFVGGTTAPTSLEVTADPTGLAVGVYTATIAVSSTASGLTNSPQTVDVSLTVVAAPAPTIFLDPTTLSFDATAGGAAPVAQSVAITNTGTGTLDQLARAITYGSGDGWLAAVFVGGTAAPTSLEVSADPTGLAAGTYTATIAVSSTAAGVTNSPQTVDVTLTVVAAPAPTIALSPSGLAFDATAGGAAPAAQSVAITNTGTGTLDQLARSITYGSGDGWLSAVFVGGTTAPTSLEVSADPTGLAAGTYTATVSVSSAASGVTNSPQTVDVSFTVAP